MALCQKNPTTIPEGFRFKEDLGVGKKGIEVRCLHFLLSADPEMRLVNTNNADYFGLDTREKVKVFQTKYVDRIWMFAASENKDPLGFVGESTREVLNAILEGGIPNPLEFTKKA